MVHESFLIGVYTHVCKYVHACMHMINSSYTYIDDTVIHIYVYSYLICMYIYTHICTYRYNRQDLVFSEYGERWTLKKKICNMHLLGSKALEALAHVRANEVGHMLRSMWESSQKGELIDVEELSTFMITNMMSQAIRGRRFFTSHFQGSSSELKEFKENVLEFNNISAIGFGDFMPSLNKLDLWGVVGKMKRLHKRFDAMFQKMVDEYIMENYDEDDDKGGRGDNKRKKKPYFLDGLIEATRDASVHERLNLSEVKALILVCVFCYWLRFYFGQSVLLDHKCNKRKIQRLN